MTTDQDAPDEGSDEDELDLEKLFDSIPSDEPDLESELDYTAGESEDEEAAEEIPDPTAAEEPRPESAGGASDEESDPKTDARPAGRFDKYLDDVNTSQGSGDIDELLARMGGTSPTPEEETPDPTDDPEPSTRESLTIEALSGDSDEEDTELPTDETQASSPSTDVDGDALEGLSEVSDVLFKGTRSGGEDTDVCNPFFDIYPPDEQNVLLVSLRQSSEDRLDAFYTEASGTPDQLAVITSSDSARSTTTAKGAEGQSNITVKVVNDPGDLTRLGITISNVLSSWQGNGNQTLVCFDSLSSLLQYADLQRVFRFIHVLQGRLGNVNATTHYHLDPEAHDSQTEATMRSLFDSVITVSAAGELSLQ